MRDVACCLITILACGCHAPGVTVGGGDDLARRGGSVADLGGGGPADLARGSDLANCHGASPSGYGCDPWSTHLYLASSAVRQGTKLRLTVVHNPDFEGGVNDINIPPEHNFSQVLTADVDLTDAVRRFLCVVFTPGPTPASFDASRPSFLTDVDHADHTLLSPDAKGTISVANLTDICGSSTLAAVYAPAIAMNGRPALTDVAFAIPLVPSPTGFTVGATFHGWLARGILYVDEEGELVPAETATVAAVQ